VAIAAKSLRQELTGGDVAKENNLLLESSTDSVNGRTTAAPRRLDGGFIYYMGVCGK